MAQGSEFREYENGVADVLASISGETARVRRNIRLPSRSGGKPRQIDVYVEGDFLGLTHARMIVDTKHWKTAIDVKDVESFLGLLDDVGADIGMIVSSAGASKGAIARAEAARGVRVKALSIDELRSWRPVGTVSRVVEIPRADLDAATKALRNAGLRVNVNAVDEEHARIEVFRHHGVKNPPGEIQQAQHDLMDTTLGKLHIAQKEISRGVTMGGGTPNHRFITVRFMGGPPIKVLAATEEELASNLEMMSSQLGIPSGLLTVERPDGWPFSSAFPF